MPIVSNFKPRPIVPRAEIPKSVQEEYDDYVYYSNFFKYRGTWYPIDDFFLINDPYWHAAMHLTNVSGLYIRLDLSLEEVIVGRLAYV